MPAGSPEAGAASGDPVVLAEPVSQGTPTQGAPDGAPRCAVLPSP